VQAQFFGRFAPDEAPWPRPISAEANVSPTLPIPKLTPREKEVLALLAQGARNKDIAASLVIAERTVKIHVRNILTKLNVGNRTEALAVAIRVGLVKPL